MKERFWSKLADVLYGDDPEGGPDYAASIVRLIIMRLRRKLKVFPFISIITECKRGWSIEIAAPQCLQEAAE